MSKMASGVLACECSRTQKRILLLPVVSLVPRSGHMLPFLQGEHVKKIEILASVNTEFKSQPDNRLLLVDEIHVASASNILPLLFL